MSGGVGVDIGGDAEDRDGGRTTSTIGFFDVEEEENHEGDESEGDVWRRERNGEGRTRRTVSLRPLDLKDARAELTDIEVDPELIREVAGHVGVRRKPLVGRAGGDEREDLEAGSLDAHRHRKGLDGDLSDQIGVGVVAVIVVISTACRSPNGGQLLSRDETR